MTRQDAKQGPACQYPDLVTPRADPRWLARRDYDPYGLMPASLPAAPRVFATEAHLERARRRLAAGDAVDLQALRRLVRACRLDEPLPPLEAAGPHPDWGGPLLPWLNSAFHNALAWRLTGESRHYERALDAMRLAADATARVTNWTGHENNEARAAGRAYDLLASALDAVDRRAARTMLKTLISALDRAGHRSCNNHNAMQMAARLSLAAALGDRQGIHDVFYGCKRRGRWRYGLIHLMRHDFLADGMQWEGVPGYHMLVLMLVCECFTVMEHLGVDLWQRTWPSLMQDDGFDEHRGWGPKGGKTLIAAFDAMLYQAFPGGDYSLLHDNGLGNLRGACAWSSVFGKAFEVYGDPRYAWALTHINGGRPASSDGPLPKWFEAERFCADFVRLEARDIPAGENPFKQDRLLSLSGRHVSGCSLFPVHGSAVLRSDVADDQAPAASLYWGPHWAGHRGPAALHMDLQAAGARVTTAPHISGGSYTDPRHSTWRRTTLAHNTVTVDGRPMFPHDFEGASLWECDHWRDTTSDGVLESFQADGPLKAVRASNDTVYPGVKLDRTVALSRDGIVDVFRVSADRPRLLDWVVHVCGVVDSAAARGSTRVDLGEQPGYRHLVDPRVLSPRTDWARLPFTAGRAPLCCSLWLGGAPGATVIMARDPDLGPAIPLGALEPIARPTCLMVRVHAVSMLFVSLWSLGADMTGGVVRGAATEDVEVMLEVDGVGQAWRFPMQGDVTRVLPRRATVIQDQGGVRSLPSQARRRRRGVEG